MSSVEFKDALETRLLSIGRQATGVSSGLKPYIQTFDNHLYDVQRTQLPFLVAFALTKDKEATQEISKYGDWVWHCQIYYLDITSETEVWDDGKKRRDLLFGAFEEILEGNHFLADSTGPLSYTDAKGVVEYVWQTEITNVTFDQSGQPGYYTFVSELYFDVHTSKN